MSLPVRDVPVDLAPRGREKVPHRGEQSARRRRRLVDEERPLREAFQEGASMVEGLAGCVRNATDSGVLGTEATITECR